MRTFLFTHHISDLSPCLSVMFWLYRKLQGV